MEIQDFVKVYQAKSDEELTQLAFAQDQLTAQAQLALQGELSRRQISIARPSLTSQTMDSCMTHAPTVVTGNLKTGERQPLGDFVAEVIRTYHGHFWLFFKITAPAVIISTIVIIAGRNEGREIARHLPQGVALLTHRTEILEIWLANSSAFLASWMAFSLAFGAICIAVDEITAGFTASASQSFLNLGERLGPFVRLCLLLSGLVAVAVAASGLAATTVFWAWNRWLTHPSRFLIPVVVYGTVSLALLVVSRFALAVPAVVLDDCRVGQAMFRSDELTQGKWMILAALLAKSLIGGYIAAMLPFWLASYVHLSRAAWFPWILTCLSMIGVATVEPTMFVGFALLYLKMSDPSAHPTKVATSQLA